MAAGCPASGETFENRNPANTDDLIGVFQKSTRTRRRSRHRRRASRVQELASRARAGPRGDALSRRPAHRRTQGAVRARHDARDGQGPERDARRRAGSHRHDLLHRRRRPAHVRTDGALGAAQQVRDVGASAARPELDHHAMEFSDGDPVVEDHSRACLRQHGRVQAGVADAVVGAQLRQGARRRRHAARASSTWSPATATRSARR